MSNRLKVGWPALRAMSLTSRLVDVPIRVQAPPRMVTYESGIRNRLGGRFWEIATSRTTGAASTTMGVLFRKAEAAPQNRITSQRPSAPSRRQRRMASRITASSRPDSSIA